ARFTTFERVQLREINIVKRSGRKSVFDRDKLERSFEIALRKREVDKDEVARAINDIVRTLEGHADGDVPSHLVGELVMQALANLDQVAYVRYASVYRNFDEATDFEDFVEKELGD
ncbi:MAG: ATP cone domain-containing protein, partial [Candidatus Puniceispirillaceae bacterium]